MDVDIPDIGEILVLFSKTMDGSSINSDSVRVADAGGVAVRGTVRYGAVPPVGDEAAIFTPEQPLVRSTQYHVAVTTAVRDFFRIPLAAEFNMSFTTIADAPWRATPITAATPSARWAHVAVWAGSEMIVYGGFLDLGGGSGIGTNTGARYNPATDGWTTMSDGFGQGNVRAVWTGTEMITWDGGSGGRYSPASDSWVPINAGAPSFTFWQTVVWTGTEVIVWGGESNGVVNTGARFSLATGTWSATNAADASGVPSPRRFHSAVWTGTEMIVWGGESFPPEGGPIKSLGDGARYNPLTDTWTPISNAGAPTRRTGHAAIWTGQEMIVIGGSNELGGLGREGARYNPATDAWSPIAPSPVLLDTNFNHAVIWSGTEMLVWGSALGSFMSGARYNPATDTWHVMTRQGNPAQRFSHTGVWTGTEMIVWGGQTPPPNLDVTGFTAVQTGGRYVP